MAKVNGPLFSMSASGTVGDNITFDKRGFVRQRVIPANPQTSEQGNVRIILLAIQKALKVIGSGPKEAVKALSPTSYRWNSFLLAAVIGNNHNAFDFSREAFNLLTAPQRAEWQSAAESNGIFDQSLSYASNSPVTAGLALFAVARALFSLGLNVGAGTPAGANDGDWADYFTSSV